ncbi:MAG: aminotransferase class V-fold PLP-dependent enzyme [Verrucomicrobiales bacterium]
MADAQMTFDVARVRQDFPILSTKVHGKPLVYLDNGATTQKPQVVIDTISGFYARGNSNIHRGVHYLSVEATDAYDQARATMAAHLGASDARGIIFTRGTTEGINLVARSFLEPRLQAGQVILLTEMEHHANIVPWQLVAAAKGARVMACPITSAGEIDEEAFLRILDTEPVAMVAFMHVSNVLATVNPAARLTALAKARGLPVLIDGAQALPHFAPDVEALGADFYVFSGHKVYGPTGIGVLWGKPDLLASMPPYQGGGDMIEKVTFEGSTFRSPPERFEAGTPNIEGAIALAAALRYHASLPQAAIAAHESALLEAARDSLAAIPGVTIHGHAKERAGVVSFMIQGVHPHDIGTLVDAEGVAIRVGHHCAQPLMRILGVPATARASFALYNTMEEVDVLVRAVDKTRRFFA